MVEWWCPFYYRYEQTFVYNLLVHLKCDEVDPDFIPKHGQGAVAASGPQGPLPLPRTSTAYRRRNNFC